MSEALLDLQTVPIERYPLIRVVRHTPFAFCGFGIDAETSDPVFIKARDPEFRDSGLRLSREADILGQFSHPQIPRLVEDGTAESQEVPYLVSEFKGGSLYPERWLAAYPYPRLAAQICLSALQPLAYSHDRDILHRDVKAGNLTMKFNGEAALLDFELGINGNVHGALDQDRPGVATGESRITSSGEVLGTADYISPERARGELGTARSDIYSMGVVLYKLLYGKLPFTAGLDIVVARKHCFMDIDLADTDRDIPEALTAVIETATQKEPKHRYGSAGEMGEAIERFLRDEAPGV